MKTTEETIPYSKPVVIPLLNTNEREAVLVEVRVHAGQKVKSGDVICTLETTKATADVVAECDGYVVEVAFSEGDTVNAGDVFCHLANTADWSLPKESTPALDTVEGGVPEGLRITQPALELARKESMSLATLPVGPLITASMLRDHLNALQSLVVSKVSSSENDPTGIIVYGAGGHGKSVIELLRAIGSYHIVGVIDDRIERHSDVIGVPVLGSGDEVLPELYGNGVRMAANAVGGIGAISVRVRIFEKLARAGFSCPALRHPTAFVEPSASLAAGAQLFPFAYVGSNARVGYGCIVNTSAVVSHDCVLGEFTNIAPGALLAGGVEIGNGCLVGMGVTVNLSVMIGAQVKIGNSATVKSDVPAHRVVRAGSVFPE